MDTKIVSKNKICIAAAIFLIILLSKYKSFQFLIHTILGRFILVLLILGISSSSVFCGIVGVLYVIIMINQNDEIYLEGFENKEKNEDMLSEFKKKLSDKSQGNTTLATSSAAMTTTETFIGREGFNMTEREDTMRKGKNSKQIPVKFDSSAKDISPSSKETFSMQYSNF